MSSGLCGCILPEPCAACRRDAAAQTVDFGVDFKIKPLTFQIPLVPVTPPAFAPDPAPVDSGGYLRPIAFDPAIVEVMRVRTMTHIDLGEHCVVERAQLRQAVQDWLDEHKPCLTITDRHGHERALRLEYDEVADGLQFRATPEVP